LHEASLCKFFNDKVDEIIRVDSEGESHINLNNAGISSLAGGELTISL